MKKTLTITLLVGLGLFTAAVSAAPIEWEPVGSGDGGVIQDSYYESASGNQYQYDLNNHVDRIQYEYDRPAQIRDAYNPRTHIDRDMGQYGGGIYSDDD